MTSFDASPSDRALPERPSAEHLRKQAKRLAKSAGVGLAAASRPMDAAELARGFKRGGRRIEQRVVQVLNTLVRYGRVTALPDGKYAARRVA
jgi:hypothetical protein